MAYNADPVQSKLAQFFHAEGDAYSYRPPNSEISVTITADDYFSSLERIQTYSARAKFAMLVLGACIMSWLYWETLHGADMVRTSIVAALAFFLPALAFHIIAMRLTLRPYDRKLLLYARHKLGWVRKGWKRGLGDFGVSPAKVAVVALIAVVVISLTLPDFRHRLAAFRDGPAVNAVVTRSDGDGRKRCRVEYTYSLAGRTFSDEAAGCDLMRLYPAGATLTVLLDPSQPAYSVPQIEGLWTAQSSVPFIFLGLAMLGFVCALPAALAYGPPDR